MRREFSVLAFIFGRRPNSREDLTESGNRARKVSGTQGTLVVATSKKSPNSLRATRGARRLFFVSGTLFKTAVVI